MNTDQNCAPTRPRRSRGMSVISGGLPWGAGSSAVLALRSTLARSPPKRSRISHGRSLCPSMIGVIASTLSIRRSTDSDGPAADAAVDNSSSTHGTSAPPAGAPARPLGAVRISAKLSPPILLCSVGHVSPAGARPVLRPRAGIVPAAGPLEQVFRLERSPASRQILDRWREALQHRIDDGPCRFDLVLAREIRSVADECSADQHLVRIHLVAGLRGHEQLHVASRHDGAGLLRLL